MIKIVLTIKEEAPGAVRIRAAGEDVGGPPTILEVEAAKAVMEGAHSRMGDRFKKEKTNVPLTFVETREKPDEHTDRR